MAISGTTLTWCSPRIVAIYRVAGFPLARIAATKRYLIRDFPTRREEVPSKVVAIPSGTGLAPAVRDRTLFAESRLTTQEGIDVHTRSAAACTNAQSAVPSLRLDAHRRDPRDWLGGKRPLG
jgi:hypothetical protein